MPYRAFLQRWKADNSSIVVAPPGANDSDCGWVGRDPVGIVPELSSTPQSRPRAPADSEPEFNRHGSRPLQFHRVRSVPGKPGGQVAKAAHQRDMPLFFETTCSGLSLREQHRYSTRPAHRCSPPAHPSCRVQEPNLLRTRDARVPQHALTCANRRGRRSLRCAEGGPAARGSSATRRSPLWTRTADFNGSPRRATRGFGRRRPIAGGPYPARCPRP